MSSPFTSQSWRFLKWVNCCSQSTSLSLSIGSSKPAITVIGPFSPFSLLADPRTVKVYTMLPVGRSLSRVFHVCCQILSPILDDIHLFISKCGQVSGTFCRLTTGATSSLCQGHSAWPRLPYQVALDEGAYENAHHVSLWCEGLHTVESCRNCSGLKYVPTQVNDIVLALDVR